jgi:hypothetical protein
MHTLSRAVLRKLPRGELASTDGAEHPQLQAGLAFRPCLDLLDSNRCMILGGDHNYPHVPAKVIHKQQEILVNSRRHWCDWTAQVTMY